MGEIADMMLDGTLCAGCGVYLDIEPTGFPVYCAGCDDGEHSAQSVENFVENNQSKKDRWRCPVCRKKCKSVEGVWQHCRDTHQPEKC